jgi:hypothetical protein
MERDPVDMIWSNLGTGKRLGQLAEKAFSRRSVTSAAEAGAENKATIAAVNRCATQKQAQARLLPQPVGVAPTRACSTTVHGGPGDGASPSLHDILRDLLGQRPT